MAEHNKTQSAAHAVISGSGIVFLSQVLGAIVFFVGQRYILSNLTKDENGILFYIQRATEFVVLVLVEAGMSQLVIRHVIQYRARADAIIATFLKLRLVLWLLASGLLLLATWYMAPAYVPATLMQLLFFLLAGRTAILRIVYEIRFRATTRLSMISIMAMLDSVFFVVLLALDVGQLNPQRILMWYFISVIPGFAVVFLASKDWRLFRVPFDIGMARKLIKESVPIILANIFIQLQHVADVVAIELFHNPTEGGIYAAAAKTFVPFAFVVTAVQTGIMPTIADYHKSDPAKCRQFIFYGLKLLLFIAITASLFCSLAAPWFIYVLTDNVYADNVAHFALFPWMSVPNFIFAFILFVNITLGFQKRNYAVTGVLAATTILANLAFTPDMAALGSIIAKMVASGLAAVVALYSIRDFIDRAGYRTIVLNYGALTAGTVAMVVLLPLCFTTLHALIAAIPIFVVLVLVTGALRKPELDLMRSFAASLVNKLRPGRGV